jgi:phytoene dehydrogenase-like protein
MKKIVIIGGGVAGLSAGIYAAMHGFSPEILEMHHTSGGQCTAWERKKYRFDYCLHWLVGTSSGPFYDIWRETNVINETTTIIDHEIHSKLQDSEGNEFIIYSDIKRWEEYLLNIAPEDEKAIRSMCNDMRNSALLEPFDAPPQLRNMFDYLRKLPKMLPVFNLIRKFGRISCAEYFDKLNFSNPILKTFLNGVYGDSEFSALVFIFMLGWFNQKNAGYILGGSYPLAQRMTEKYLSLGGKISYNQKVTEIIVRKDKACGVITENGSRIMADYVISAADGYSTIFEMLDGKYLSKKIIEAYSKWKLFTPIVQVSFGVLKVVPEHAPIIIKLCKGTKIGSTTLQNGYSVVNYSFDSTMAPEGKTTIVLRFDSPWEQWQNLKGDAYKHEKQLIEKDAIACLEDIYPGVSAFIEVTDIATPVTNVFYTGVKDGAYEGFLPTKENMMKSLDMQLPGLKNFYMVGQWLFPGGGLPPSAQTGKWAIDLICKKEGI